LSEVPARTDCCAGAERDMEAEFLRRAIERSPERSFAVTLATNHLTALEPRAFAAGATRLVWRLGGGRPKEAFGAARRKEG
jgi:hypothetical protein